jgi:cell fate regulator YaaT (PSP1 superfamily)
MPQTIEVRFKGTRRDFFLWHDEQDPLRLKDAVVVEAERGLDLGRVHSAGEVAEKKCATACSGCSVGGKVGKTEKVAEAAESADPAEVMPPAPPTASAALKKIVRRATTDDLRTAGELRIGEEDARRRVIEKVRKHNLDMKVSDAEWQWDRNKLTVFFTADKRVDFRALVRDLAGMFRARIELRQIGVRDETARLQGVGRCGREFCCSTWLTELSPVSLALAKDQHLSLNPAQISGGCGRLLCCLKYEHEFYVAARRRFPREGKTLETARGPERVVAVDIFRERVFLRHAEQGSRIIPLVQLLEEMEHAPPPALEAEPGHNGNGEAKTRGASVREAPVIQPPAPQDSGAAASAQDPTDRPRRRRRRRGRRGREGPGAPPEAPPPNES